MLNKDNKTIGYALGRFLGLCQYAAKEVEQTITGDRFPNGFIERPHRYMAEISRAIDRAIGEMRRKGWTKKAQMCEMERLEILDLIDPDQMPTGGEPVSLEMQGMIQLGSYHELGYLWEK